ncbi:tetratricopeptide repeat protein [Haloferula chungangensis]|uniref:Tetratricopeptide repeat protein n=1 Tax=Haloferula chungangensis TaxID=1048331 RepID=A0ABW2L179_9BACT
MARILSDLTSRSALLAAAALCVFPLATSSAQSPVPAERPAPAAFDPSDVYFQAWLLAKDSEKLVEEGKHLEALNKLRRARQMFGEISKNFPTWKPEMLQGRIDKTVADIARVTPDALKQEQGNDRATAELEGGVRRGAGTQGQSPHDLEIEMPGGSGPVETLETRRIAELEQEAARLKQQIGSAPQAGGTPANQAERQRDMAFAQLRRTQSELDQLRRKTGSQPMQEEVRALSQRIDALEREKSVMGEALGSSQAETKQAKAQIDALQAERVRLMQEVADLSKNLEIERQTANEVVAGQRKQLKHFQELLAKKDSELDVAKGRIQSLETELAEVRESFNELREERDDLLRERDQMAALLKLNEAGQLQQVIDQNMALDRELRETKERYETLQEDSDASKDDLLEALRDLAISKLRIQEFRREKTAQENRIAELQSRLLREDRALASGGADPVETQMLRDIIKKQMDIQEKRREAREILLATLEEKGEADESIRRAMNVYKGTELNLSPEELRMVEDQQVDGVIISRHARPRSEVNQNIAGLERELEPYSKAGTRAYQKGRLHAAREAFEMIIDRNPGDTVAMCKLGVVELALGETYSAVDIFRQATGITPNLPYAQQMLGHSLTQIGENGEALVALKKAVELAPTDAKGLILLGNLQYRLGNIQAAEEAFKTAIACNETLVEPHFNLAILYANEGKKEKALESYSKALELGAVPNLDLEKKMQR